MRILIIIALFSLNLYAQDRWKKLNGPVGGAIAGLYAKGDTLVLSTHLFKSSIYYSVDGGKSWQQSFFKDPTNVGGFTSTSKNNYIVVSPAGYIYRSSDLINWEKVFEYDAKFLGSGIDSEGTIYAGSEFGLIFTSSDEGSTWKLSKEADGTSVFNFLAVNHFIFAGAMHGLYKKDIRFPGWNKINLDSLTNIIIPFLDADSNLYFYTNRRLYKSDDFGGTWTYKESADFFYGNSPNSWIYNNRFIGAFHDETGWFGDGWGIALSDDNGTTWRWNNKGLPPKFSSAFRLAKSGVNTFVATNAAGVFKSTNFGDSWFPINKGLNAADVLDLTFDEMGYMYTASWSSGFQRSTDKGETWQVINNGLTNSYCYSIISDDKGILLGSSEQGTFRSSDKGESWEQLPRFGSTFPYRFYKGLNNKIYSVNYHDGLYSTSDMGNSWQRLDKNFASRGIFGFAVDSSGSLYAGTRGGWIYKSTDEGLNWTLSREGINSPLGVIDIKVSPNGYIYAGTMDEGLLRSTDNGMSWHKISTFTNRITVQSLEVSKEGEIFASFSLNPDWPEWYFEQLYYSNDNGETWTEYTSNMKYISIRKIVFDEDDVYLATDEAVWRSNPDSAVTAAEEVKLISSYSLSQNYPNPFNPSTKIKYQIPEAGHVTLKVYDILGREAAVLVDKFQSPGEYEAEFRAVRLSSGIYFYKLTAGKYTEIKKMQILK